LTTREAACRLCLTTSAIKARLHRAKGLLRETLKRRGFRFHPEGGRFAATAPRLSTR
jgi:DNA-directed RNA polymerase specialized sigma24 family protein